MRDSYWIGMWPLIIGVGAVCFCLCKLAGLFTPMVPPPVVIHHPPIRSVHIQYAQGNHSSIWTVYCTFKQLLMILGAFSMKEKERDLPKLSL